MKYIISLDGRESDPVDITEIVMLHQSGALIRNSRVREDRPDAEWTTPERAFPFLSTVKTWSELTGRNTPASFSLSAVELNFWDLVWLIFKITVASIPAALLVFIIIGVMSLVATGVAKAALYLLLRL